MNADDLYSMHKPEMPQANQLKGHNCHVSMLRIPH